MTGRIRRRSFLHHELSDWSYIRRILWPEMTLNHQILHEHPYRSCLQPNRIWRHQLIPVSSYQSLKNSRKCRFRALGRISRERFKQGLRNFTALSETIILMNQPDTTSLAASGRLQNAVECCIKVRKTDPAGKESKKPYCRDFKVEWRGILPTLTNWLTSCYWKVGL